MSETSTERAHEHASPSVGKSLTGKLGPLPGYAWVALALVGYLLYRWWKNKQAGTGTTAASSNTSATSTSSYPNGVDTTGYLSDFGPGSYTVTPPIQGSDPGSTGTSGTTGSTQTVVDHSHDLQYVVADIADFELLLANGVPTTSIVYSGYDPNASKVGQDPSYGVPAGLALPSSDNLVWVGLAGSQAPAGATKLQGANRQQTLQMIQDYVRQHPTVKLSNTGTGGIPLINGTGLVGTNNLEHVN